MNYKNYLVIIGLLCGQMALGVESSAAVPVLDSGAGPFAALRCITQDRVAVYQQKIGKTVQRHNYIRTAVKLGGTAACLFVIYRSVRSYCNQAPAKAVGDTAQAVVQQISQEDGVRLTAMLNKFQPAWFSFQWWKNSAVWIVNSLASSAVLSAGYSLTGRFMHEDTIEWYVRENTKIKELADELLAYQGQSLAKMAAHELSAQDLYYHRVTLAGIARSLVEQAEAIAGFMESRLAYFKNQGVILLPDEFLQPTRLVASVNSFVHAVQQQQPAHDVVDSLDEVKKTCSMVMQCATDIQQMVNRFQGVEYSIQWRIINGG